MSSRLTGCVRAVPVALTPSPAKVNRNVGGTLPQRRLVPVAFLTEMPAVVGPEHGHRVLRTPVERGDHLAHHLVGETDRGKVGAHSVAPLVLAQDPLMLRPPERCEFCPTSGMSSRSFDGTSESRPSPAGTSRSSASARTSECADAKDRGRGRTAFHAADRETSRDTRPPACRHTPIRCAPESRPSLTRPGTCRVR